MSFTDTIERFLDAASRGDIEVASACFTADATLVVPAADGDHRFDGREQIRQALATTLAGFSDVAYSPVRRYVATVTITEEGRIAARHTGTFAGVAASGGSVDVAVRMIAEPTDEPEPTSQTADPTARRDALLQRLTVWVETSTLWTQLGIDIEGNAAAAAVAVAGIREAEDGELRIIEGSSDDLGAAAPVRKRRGGLIAAVLVLVLLLAAVGAFVLHSSSSNNASGATATKPTATSRPTNTLTRPATTGSALPRVAVQNPNVAPTVQAGQQVVLGADVLFHFDSATLTPAAKAEIAALTERIRTNRVHGTIQVNGYTDNIGSAAYARDLSRRRALAVAVAMQRGLAGLPVQLQPQGFGDTHPVASNATTAGQAHNRRVTIVLPKM